MPNLDAETPLEARRKAGLYAKARGWQRGVIQKRTLDKEKDYLDCLEAVENAKRDQMAPAGLRRLQEGCRALKGQLDMLVTKDENGDYYMEEVPAKFRPRFFEVNNAWISNPEKSV